VPLCEILPKKSAVDYNDKSYCKGVEIEKEIYDINGFQVRFFREKEIQDLMKGFELIWIVTFYLVSR
jgi:hypothetical protein